MQSFTQRVMAPDVRIDELASWLDGLSDEARIAAAMSLGAKGQRRLWALCRGRAVQLDELVPPERGEAPVHHLGRNSQPVLSRFEKRMRRAPDASDTLWGYNEGPTRRLIGPGYFVVHPTADDSRGAVVVDYLAVPSQTPEGWPEVKANGEGLQRFVYQGMHDYLRRVTSQVTIGHAYRHDRRTPHSFILCREH